MNNSQKRNKQRNAGKISKTLIEDKLNENLNKLSLNKVEELLEMPNIISVCRCELDHDKLMDNELLETMLKLENNYALQSNYFDSFQSKINPEMRELLASWMYEVCEEQNCTNTVFSLAINLFDRLLSIIKVEKYHLQLLGSVCLFIASKMKLNSENQLSAQKLIEYTDFSITLEELVDWESLVLHKLEWDVASIVATDFVEVFLHRISGFDRVSRKISKKIREHTYAFTGLCARDVSFSIYQPSLVAAACITCAIEGLDDVHNLIERNEIYAALKRFGRIDTQKMLSVAKIVENLFNVSQTKLNLSQTDADCEYEYDNNNHSENSDSSATSSIESRYDIMEDLDSDCLFDFNEFASKILVDSLSNALYSCSSSSGIQSLSSTPTFEQINSY